MANPAVPEIAHCRAEVQLKGLVTHLRAPTSRRRPRAHFTQLILKIRTCLDRMPLLRSGVDVGNLVLAQPRCSRRLTELQGIALRLDVETGALVRDVVRDREQDA